MLIDEETKQRFWSKVDVRGEDDCWDWKAAISTSKNVITKTGSWSPPRYSDLSTNVHKAAWQLTYGYISKDVRVAHLCKNSLCCNPKHLVANTLTERFWRKVDKTPGQGIGDCWMWKNRVSGSGYGQFRLDPKKGHQSASRVSYLLTYGEIPDNAVVCHRCDFRACCNPAHLYLGNQSDNLIDMVMKGRGPSGEKNHEAKLTKSDVEQIKKLVNDGVAQHLIASQFNVTQSCISLISTGKSWKHLNAEAYSSRKLSEFQEEAIARLLAEGVSQKDIAIKYSVSQATISKVKRDNKSFIDELKKQM